MQREPTYRHTYRAALRAKSLLAALRGNPRLRPRPAPAVANFELASLLKDSGSADVRSWSGPVPSPQPRASALSISVSGDLR